jgi:hypothetical protein
MTMVFCSSRCRTAGSSITASGSGLVVIRRHAPAPSRSTVRPADLSRSASASVSGCPIGFDGRTSAGSNRSTRVWVTTVTTSRRTPAVARAFCNDCWSMYPIQPAVSATSTPSGSGSTIRRATSLRTSESPTCGPFPCTMTIRQPSRASVTTAAMLSRARRNWLAIVAGSSARDSAFPPSAKTAVLTGSPVAKRAAS